MGILENLSGFYEKADVVGKQQIIGSIFTRNLIFSKNKVRTTKVNEVVSMLVKSGKAFEKKKRWQSNKKFRLSPWVTLRGSNSNHFLDDWLKFNKLRTTLLYQQFWLTIYFILLGYSLFVFQIMSR
jgi:hypothetical protein